MMYLLIIFIVFILAAVSVGDEESAREDILRSMRKHK